MLKFRMRVVINSSPAGVPEITPSRRRVRVGQSSGTPFDMPRRRGIRMRKTQGRRIERPGRWATRMGQMTRPQFRELSRSIQNHSAGFSAGGPYGVQKKHHGVMDFKTRQVALAPTSRHRKSAQRKMILPIRSLAYRVFTLYFARKPLRRSVFPAALLR